MYVKPINNDTKIRMPERNNAHLPSAGARVERNAYWLRRISDGDAIEITEKDFKKAAKSATTGE